MEGLGEFLLVWAAKTKPGSVRRHAVTASNEKQKVLRISAGSGADTGCLILAAKDDARTSAPTPACLLMRAFKGRKKPRKPQTCRSASALRAVVRWVRDKN